MTDGQATREAVRGALRNIGEVFDKRDGTLVFYFSGHGWAVEGRNILATYDAGAANMAGSGLPLDEVLQAMAATGSLRQPPDLILQLLSGPLKPHEQQSFDRGSHGLEPGNE